MRRPAILVICTIMAFSALTLTGCPSQCGTLPSAGDIPEGHAAIGEWSVTVEWDNGVVRHDDEIEFFADGSWVSRVVNVYTREVIGTETGTYSVVGNTVEATILIEGPINCDYIELTFTVDGDEISGATFENFCTIFTGCMTLDGTLSGTRITAKEDAEPIPPGLTDFGSEACLGISGVL